MSISITGGNKMVCRYEIVGLINEYIKKRKFFDEELRKHGISTIDGMAAFCNRERCSDFISDLEKLIKE